ncbi:UNVERIFIED_ORG: hypothetical protein J2791_003287 [Burkholderia contaminans]|nr:hypothetical protein [Burkholderia contaminans]
MQFIASKIAIIEKCGSWNTQEPHAAHPREEADGAEIADHARVAKINARATIGNAQPRCAAPKRIPIPHVAHMATPGAQNTTPRVALQCAHRRGGPPLDFPPGTTTLLFQYGHRTVHAHVAHGPFAGTHGQTIAARPGTTTMTNTQGDDSC